MKCFCAWTSPSTALTRASAHNHQGASVEAATWVFSIFAH